MTHTLLAAPLRERVVGAKGVVALVTGAVLAVVSTIVALAIAVPWLGSGASSELGDGDVLAAIGRLVLARFSSVGGVSDRKVGPWKTGICLQPIRQGRKIRGCKRLRAWYQSERSLDR